MQMGKHSYDSMQCESDKGWYQTDLDIICLRFKNAFDDLIYKFNIPSTGKELFIGQRGY